MKLGVSSFHISCSYQSWAWLCFDHPKGLIRLSKPKSETFNWPKWKMTYFQLWLDNEGVRLNARSSKGPVSFLKFLAGLFCAFDAGRPFFCRTCRTLFFVFFCVFSVFRTYLIFEAVLFFFLFLLVPTIEGLEWDTVFSDDGTFDQIDV